MQAGDKIGVSAPISTQSLVYNSLFWLFMVCSFSEFQQSGMRSKPEFDQVFL